MKELALMLKATSFWDHMPRNRLHTTSMKACIKHLLLVPMLITGLGLILAGQVAAQIISVPGTSCPWLAGMPDGATGPHGFDTAPAESPVQVSTTVTTGTIFTFSATGGVLHYNNPSDPKHGPSGNPSNVVNLWRSEE